MRVCCDEEKSFEVVYDGGPMDNVTVQVCKNCITKHPWNKRIISNEVIVN